MPEYIPKNDVNRLFQYPFFQELDELLPEFVVMNPVFLANGTKQEARMQKNAPTRFQKGRDLIYPKVVERNNLHTFEQGTFLIVHPYVKREDNKKALKGKPVQRWMLLAQWFDVDGKPVFDKDTSLTHIKELQSSNTVDGHLGLALMETMRDAKTKEVNNTLYVINGPQTWLDAIQGPWELISMINTKQAVGD